MGIVANQELAMSGDKLNEDMESLAGLNQSLTVCVASGNKSTCESQESTAYIREIGSAQDHALTMIHDSATVYAYMPDAVWRTPDAVWRTGQASPEHGGEGHSEFHFCLSRKAVHERTRWLGASTSAVSCAPKWRSARPRQQRASNGLQIWAGRQQARRRPRRAAAQPRFPSNSLILPSNSLIIPLSPQE